MPVAAHPAPNGDERLRIAITSPDILARIRQVFAGKNLVVDIVGMPYVEVAVRPADAGGAGRSAPGNAVSTLAAGAGSQRLRAEYRLSVIRDDEQQPGTTGQQIPDDGSRQIALSQRQREVLSLMSRGARNAEIAETLHVTEKTVKNHINRIFRELGTDNRVEAVLMWQRYQEASSPGPDVRVQ